MNNLDDFLLFSAIEDAREESSRENSIDNNNSFDPSWNSGSSDDKDE